MTSPNGKTYELSSTAVLTGSVQFVSVPGKANIILDGNDTLNVTPFTITDIDTGPHSFVLKLAGYTDVTGTVDVKGGVTSQVYVVLTEVVPEVGAINIFTTPAGADIYIDGEIIRDLTTPAVVKNISPGAHTLKLVLVGYEDVERSFSIIKEKTTYMNIELSPLEEIGAVDIISNPTGARVYIDGKDTFKDTPATLTGLSAGSHNMKLALEGYDDFTKTFKIEASKTIIIEALLKERVPEDDTTMVIVAVGIFALAALLAKGK